MVQDIVDKFMHDDPLGDLFIASGAGAMLHAILAKYQDFDLLNASPEDIDTIIIEILDSPELLEAEEFMRLDLEEGKDTLDSMVSTVIMDITNLYYKNRPYSVRYFQEALAYCESGCLNEAKNPTVAAKGIFDKEVSQREIVWKPRNLIYSRGNENIKKGSPACPTCNGTTITERSALTYIVGEPIPEVPEEVIKEILANVAKDTSLRIGPFVDPVKRQDHLTKKLVESLGGFFKELYTVMSHKRSGRPPHKEYSINYHLLYQIMRNIRADDFDVFSLNNMDSTLLAAVDRSINRSMHQPFRIRRSIKDFKGLSNKVLEYIYGGRDDGPSDLYRFRVICPTVDQCYQLVDKLHTHGWGILDEEDILASPRNSHSGSSQDYRSYHLSVKAGDIVCEIQLRTYEMDRAAELDARQKHVAYKSRKLDLVDQNPGARKLIEAVLNSAEVRKRYTNGQKKTR